MLQSIILTFGLLSLSVFTKDIINRTNVKRNKTTRITTITSRRSTNTGTRLKMIRGMNTKSVRQRLNCIYKHIE